MLGFNGMYHDNHSTIYVTQTVMPYTLNLYSDVCQLFLNKTGKKKVSEIDILESLSRPTR